MAREPRPKTKPKPKIDDKAQFERFVETARKLGVEEVGLAFNEALDKVAPARSARRET
jgi:hypothetical protein